MGSMGSPASSRCRPAQWDADNTEKVSESLSIDVELSFVHQDLAPNMESQL